jgi:formamidopyrimidine-DNA glycosylase
MPELPEVETVRQGLLPLLGASVRGVEVFRERSVRHHVGGAAAFSAELPGAVICEVARRGKFLWFPLAWQDDDETPTSAQLEVPARALVAHLGMSGQLLLRFGGPQSDSRHPHPRHPHLRAQVVLEGKSGQTFTLDFIAQRTFGHLAIADMGATGDRLPAGAGTGYSAIPSAVRHIARDVLDPNLDSDFVVNRIQGSGSEVKKLLLDQTKVSGIGNIYADEALWEAQVHPQAPGRSLSSDQITRVLQAARVVIASSLQKGGTSFDALYVDAAGNPGDFASSLQVYGRENEPCPRCGNPLQRVVVGGRSSHFCDRCQTL